MGSNPSGIVGTEDRLIQIIHKLVEDLGLEYVTVLGVPVLIVDRVYLTFDTDKLPKILMEDPLMKAATKNSALRPLVAGGNLAVIVRDYEEGNNYIYPRVISE